MQVPHLYINNLLQDIAQLDTSSIEQLKADMEVILAKRKQIVKQKKEQQLVQKIHQYTASDTYKRYQVLLEKSRLETITTEDYQELMTLTTQIENNNTERLEHLMILAKIRQKSLREVMQELGLLAEKKEYFAKRVMDRMDNLWKKNDWSDDTMEEWLNADS